MKTKVTLLDEITLSRAIARMSHEIIEKNKGIEDVVLVGIKTRGVPMAKCIGENIKRIEGVDLKIGSIDITHYRDDRSCDGERTSVNATEIDFDIQNKNVILCDDVLFTGRTARAGIEALLHVGRPKSIQLAVIVDRGHRELPIRADYVGKNIPTSMHEQIEVMFAETDGDNGVVLCEV
ncbi:MAG: bifunctional pyr operon transcriptional regulator/uracil phosphoribosyltransferase PyrR [Bacteroides sp.]|nr:bifunctional pyr operon transcriptional regulator/uracil phosphoribosyltransferase PyrR [Bacillota bacterium]MCM1394275.1 bifunctional pyr operon transcriptional regulator/uracil phosphoribosyltransferase PyrR [[Eubacterium] siraeum]MCM1455956.1 bifunctional pyr operon transcriptional regulator/uracil phosphoribosyltransferase PyrR [Bacteroides sp.]